FRAVPLLDDQLRRRLPAQIVAREEPLDRARARIARRGGLRLAVRLGLRRAGSAGGFAGVRAGWAISAPDIASKPTATPIPTDLNFISSSLRHFVTWSLLPSRRTRMPDRLHFDERLDPPRVLA